MRVAALVVLFISGFLVSCQGDGGTKRGDSTPSNTARTHWTTNGLTYDVRNGTTYVKAVWEATLTLETATAPTSTIGSESTVTVHYP